MKCIHCGKDSKLKERAGGRCKHCQRPFAFEPTQQQGLVVTDPGFQAAIVAVSGQGRLAFTTRQLYYQALRPQARRAARRGRGGRGVPFGVVAAAGFFIVWVLLGRALPTWQAGLLAATIVAGLAALRAAARARADRRSRRSFAAPIDLARFTGDYLGRWQRAHGPLAGLLPDMAQAPTGGAASAHAEELQGYSFDRLLVCDRAETAAFLLANNLHTETNTPIVSIDGYPSPVFDQVLAMVRRNPRLQVFALHDADVPGCLLPLRLREDPRWFPQPSIAITDIGLRPRQVAAHGAALAAVQRGGPVEVPADLARLLSRGERAWLATGHRAELAAIPPARLMQLAYRAFTRAGDEVARQQAAAARDPRGFFRTAF